MTFSVELFSDWEEWAGTSRTGRPDTSDRLRRKPLWGLECRPHATLFNDTNNRLQYLPRKFLDFPVGWAIFNG